MIKGKEIVEIGRFVDDKIVTIPPNKQEDNSLKFELIYEKGTGNVDFEIRFVDEDVKQKKNQK